MTIKIELNQDDIINLIVKELVNTNTVLSVIEADKIIRNIVIHLDEISGNIEAKYTYCDEKYL